MRLRLVVAMLFQLFPPLAAALDVRAPAAPDFVEQTASSNTFEIRSSTLALTAAESAAVKAFARQMIDDHTKAASELAIAVREAGGNLPIGQELQTRHQEMLMALGGAAGREFDERYAAMLLAVHEAALALFTAYARAGDNHRLMGFAAGRRVTTLRHRHMFHTLDRLLGTRPQAGDGKG